MASSAPFKGVHVEVISNGWSLPLYNDPDGLENEESRTRQHYIEAVTGATFIIRVTLTEDFEMGRCDAARISMTFDGVGREWHQDISRRDGFKNQPLKDRQVVFSSVRQFCEKSAQWRRGKLCFGELVMTETTAESIPSPDQMKQLGQILLKIRRVTNIRNTTIISPKRSLHRVGEVSEKAMKGQAIANTIDFADYVPAQKPRFVHAHADVVKGPLGRTLRWKIFYRSKGTLRMLGCIPRTPSPHLEVMTKPHSPVFTPLIKPDVTVLTDREQEIRSLRARLSLLESDTIAKPEADDTPRVKRERDDLEITGSRKKSCHPNTVEIVDLTAD